MRTLDSVSCGNQYTNAAKIDSVFNSSGGYFAVTGNDAYAQLFYGRRGQELTTAEFHVPVGVGILYPGTIGIQFRNYQATKTAVVSAALSNAQEPSVALSAGGIAGAAAAAVLTGRFNSAAVVLNGSGFTVTKNGVGDFTVNITTAFANTPTVVAGVERTAGQWRTIMLAGTPTITKIRFQTWAGTPPVLSDPDAMTFAAWDVA